MSRYRKLGEFIRHIDERNKDLSVKRLLGLSIEKCFIESIANTIGTNFQSYKIVKKGQFAYGPVTSRNGDKITIALLNEQECIISSSYTVFEVTDKTKLLPEYLMLWFSRPEFDRYARYKSHGSVREIFDWEEMCRVELPVPPIAEQQKIVNACNAITARIQLKQKIFDICFRTGKSFFNELIKRQKCKPIKLISILTILKDGTHNPPKRFTKGIPILMGQNIVDCFIDHTGITYIQPEEYKKIHKYYEPQENDIVITKIGTVGKIAMLRKKDLPLAIHCNSALLRFNSEIGSTIGFWAVSSDMFLSELKKKISQTVQDFVSLGSLADADIYIPYIDENKIRCLNNLIKNMSNINDSIHCLHRIKQLLISHTTI